MIKATLGSCTTHRNVSVSSNWLAYLYIIVLEYSVNMPAICKSDGDTPRLEKKRSIRMKVKVEIEKQSERYDPQMGAKIISTASFSLDF